MGMVAGARRGVHAGGGASAEPTTLKSIPKPVISTSTRSPDLR